VTVIVFSGATGVTKIVVVGDGGVAVCVIVLVGDGDLAAELNELNETGIRVVGLRCLVDAVSVIEECIVAEKVARMGVSRTGDEILTISSLSRIRELMCGGDALRLPRAS
jgi:hypothetical protein